jgi:hypothetical protein
MKVNKNIYSKLNWVLENNLYKSKIVQEINKAIASKMRMYGGGGVEYVVFPLTHSS